VTEARRATTENADRSTVDAGRRLWSDAAREAIGDLTDKVRDEARKIHGDVDVDAVHDMRTATRRLRTSIELYRDVAPPKERRRVERELRRVARRLGAVRDLDVLIQGLENASNGQDADAADDVQPLKSAWTDERTRHAARLVQELERRRFDRSLDVAADLGKVPRGGHRTPPDGQAVTHRVGNRAPELVWSAFGELLGYELDVQTADPARIHEMRIAAKKLRYTLEAFEDAFEPAATLAEEVTSLQDAAGDMHDAIVAQDRAQSFLDQATLHEDQAEAVRAFATAQAHRAARARTTVARRLSSVRSQRFRAALTDAISGCADSPSGSAA
jgi:CHAD domain-containing protein